MKTFGRRVADPLLALFLAIPLLWILLQIVMHASEIAWPKLMKITAGLSLVTLLYGLIATAMAFTLALPAAFAIARANRRGLRIIFAVLLLALLQPVVVYLYGWSQVFRLADWFPEPQSWADVLRCLWTLACWLWPVPAAALGLAARSLDRETLDAARLDGGQQRIRFHQYLAPAAAAAAITLALALQQFTVFEQTNIPVVATEARTLFSVGLLSGGATITSADSLDSQAARIAAAAAMILPIALAILLLAHIARRLISRSALSLAIVEDIRLPSREFAAVFPLVLLALCLGLPLLCMYMALATPLVFSSALEELAPQLTGSVLISGAVAMACLIIGLLACVLPMRLTLLVSIICFLIGGQLLSLSTIHLLSTPFLSAIYDSALPAIFIHTAMFLWISLLPARLFRTESWHTVRSSAQVDGASSLQLLLRLIIPATWPWHIAAALVVFSLSFGEIPAVMILQPQRPQMLIPTLMTWVHLLRYDAMIRGAILLSGVIFAATVIATVALSLGRKRS